MKAAPGLISLTCDTWTLEEKDAYIVLKAHYVSTAGEWLMEDDLIGFTLLQGSHTGKNLAKIVFETCKKLGIVTKVTRLGLLIALISFHNGLFADWLDHDQ